MLNRVIIDLQALLHNLDQVRKLVGARTKIMGIVKSDAYGHGSLPVSLAFQKRGIDALGVAQLHEALELREGGVTCPVVVLSGIRTRADAEEVVRRKLIPVLFDIGSAEVLAEECRRRERKIAVHVKVDTGMGRLGVGPEEIGPFLRRISDLKALSVDGLMSHLSSADEADPGFTLTQLARFREAIETGRSQGFDLRCNHVANSAGIMAHRESFFHMVRPGIMLYGGRPSPEFVAPVPLRPAMQFVCRVLQIKELPDQVPVSYGRTYYTKGRRRIAVLSAGYGDGLPRSMSNRAKVLIREKTADVVGRVCMNLIMCDVTDVEGVLPGDEAVCLGGQGARCITGDDLAAWSETISYEVFCSIGQRNRREYVA
ncbi:MAG: alanine racemase [Deltaproteobacteria bacterium]|nr:alanine racemase [Deltaproteobacteria bacterium]